MVSFIIPAHNEEALIGRAIESIHAAARGCGVEYEIVVADDASTDGTARISEQNGARVVASGRRQISATRNAGARAALGDRFIFVDADSMVPADVLAETLAALREGAVGGGALTGFDGPIPLYARMLLSVLLVMFRVLRLCGGAYLFCTRAAYEAVGGWDETVFAGEEILMCRALKRHGRFRLISARIITSGRKLRAHSATEVLWTLFRLSIRGQRAVRSRDGLDLWYGERRTDPGHATEQA
jgi:glycosyltransferase involved in cell wall biosynthesis